MAVLVVEIEDALVDFHLRHAALRLSHAETLL
jgi:hypothetical protein